MAKVSIGEKIIFVRKDITIEAVVKKVYPNSVICEIDKSIADGLGYETPLTVVSHKRYKKQMV